MVRDAIRDWVEAEFVPIVAEHHRAGTFPVELIPKLGELGVFGATLKGYGCAGLNNVAYGLIMQELERGDSGLRSAASVQSGLVMYPIYTYGSETQKDQWLPGMASGEKIGCFGLTEPDHGSDPGAMKTRASRHGNSYVLNGTKLWITNGSIADVAVVWAREDDGDIGGFLVERGTPGFSTLDIHGKFSMRASITSELSFQDCRIPADNRLPGVKGLRGPLGCLNQARYGIAWGALGAAMAVYDWALQYGQQRIQFGKPIASFQLVQQKLHQGPAAVPATGPSEGRGQGAPPTGLPGQDEQCPDGAGRGPSGPRHPGGGGHRGRAPRHPAYVESRNGQYL
jgi:glutaryl-CoA dehydrogenase